MGRNLKKERKPIGNRIGKPLKGCKCSAELESVSGNITKRYSFSKLGKHLQTQKISCCGIMVLASLNNSTAKFSSTSLFQCLDRLW